MRDDFTDLYYAPAQWKLVALQVAVALLAVIVRIPVALLGLPAVALGVMSLSDLRTPRGNAFPKLLWPWDSKVSTTPEPWWWESNRWQHKLGDRFSVWWWRAIRNPTNNFVRYTLKDAAFREDLVITPTSWVRKVRAGHYPGRWAYQYIWDVQRPWLGWFAIGWKWTETKSFEARLGFKLGQVFDGLGWTARIVPWKHVDRLKR